MPSDRLTTWLAEQHVDGRLVVRLGRRGDELVAEFSDLGTFASDAQGTRPHFDAVQGANPTMVEKLDASKLDALVRHLRGKLTLHGGAVGFDERALALVGPSGSGKSTLAAAMCSRGAGLVSDDTVAVEFGSGALGGPAVTVLPTQTLAWLLPDARAALGIGPSNAGKSSVVLPGSQATSLRLAAVVGLAFGAADDGIVVRRLRGQEAFSLVTTAIIRFVVDEAEAHAREFDQVRRLVACCPVFELRRPSDLDRLGQTADVLFGLARDLPPAEGAK